MWSPTIKYTAKTPRYKSQGIQNGTLLISTIWICVLFVSDRFLFCSRFHQNLCFRALLRLAGNMPFKPRSQNDIVLNAAAQSKDGTTYGRCNHPSWDFDRAEKKNAHMSLAGRRGAGRFKPCLTLFTLAVFSHPARNTWRKNNHFLVWCSWRGGNLRRWQLTSIISKSICWFLSRRPADISGFQVQGALLGTPASNCLLRRFYCLE